LGNKFIKEYKAPVANLRTERGNEPLPLKEKDFCKFRMNINDFSSNLQRILDTLSIARMGTHWRKVRKTVPIFTRAQAREEFGNKQKHVKKKHGNDI